MAQLDHDTPIVITKNGVDIEYPFVYCLSKDIQTRLSDLNKGLIEGIKVTCEEDELIDAE